MAGSGPARHGLMNIGQEATGPFAVLPDPATLFERRAKRFRDLAPGHELEPYLRFLGDLSQAQHEVQAALPPDALPQPSAHQAFAHGMPPLHALKIDARRAAQPVIAAVLDRLAGHTMPAVAAEEIAALKSASADVLETTIAAALDGSPDADRARRALASAGLQVHFARLASRLDAGRLTPIADGACPACGSPPVVSAVVGWKGAANTRYCACSLCATMWNVVRVKCVLCSATGGIGYRAIEGKPATVKAETCEACNAYVKILAQVEDPALEPVADDVASLGLDMLMAEEGIRRAGRNPYLLGY